METRKEIKFLIWTVVLFLTAFFLPANSDKLMTAIHSTLDLVKWYAREHIVLCLLPAFFIAGVIAVFVSQGAVLKYFGANARKWVSYTVASVSGGILAVCSCTILPLFTSIYKRGAGLGPAIAFLYSGPAISILSIILTARILGIEMGIARIIGAVTFAIVIGLVMSFIFRKEERDKEVEQMNIVPPPEKRPLWQTAVFFFTLVAILVFANWGAPAVIDRGIWAAIYNSKWWITSALAIGLCVILVKILYLRARWIILGAIAVAVSAFLANVFIPDAKSAPLMPMIVSVAVLAIVLLFDKNDDENHDGMELPGIIPDSWVGWAVGGNSLLSNFFASFTGAFTYFATLTEVPIIQGLLASGMGKGPALALLLAGPSLSLPNMLVIRSVMGTKKTVIYVALVIVMATISGWVYGYFF